jgi:hypothetical protein
LAETVLPDVIDLARRLNLEVIVMHAYAVPLSAYYGAEDYYNPYYKDLAAQLKGRPGVTLKERSGNSRSRGSKRSRPLRWRARLQKRSSRLPGENPIAWSPCAPMVTQA